jgi:hypothetical protein
VIPDNAFRGCSSLTSVTIPEAVTAIGSNAFYNCTALLSITLPASVTVIGTDAFFGCKLPLVTILNETPPEIVTRAFTIGPQEIKVPASAFAAYRDSASWTPYRARIRPIEQ